MTNITSNSWLGWLDGCAEALGFEVEAPGAGAECVVRPEGLVPRGAGFSLEELMHDCVAFLLPSTLGCHVEALATEGAEWVSFEDTLAGLVEWEEREGCSTDFVGEQWGWADVFVRWVDDEMNDSPLRALVRAAMEWLRTDDGLFTLNLEWCSAGYDG